VKKEGNLDLYQWNLKGKLSFNFLFLLYMMDERFLNQRRRVRPTGKILWKVSKIITFNFNGKPKKLRYYNSH